MSSAVGLRCVGCEASPRPDDPYPFRCPNADSGDDRDHVLAWEAPAPGRRLSDPQASQPLIRHRKLLFSHALAMERGMADSDYVAGVVALDRAVAETDGHGLRATPFEPWSALGARLGFRRGAVWVKDETGGVSGSHKSRHLMGLAVTLEVLERTGLASRAESDRRGLAIASCGNAALAAAVIARAARRPLRVFVPPDAPAAVLARLQRLDASIVSCPRAPGERGDPCLRTFRHATRGGALPFCCQGSENGLAIEGGRTLAWEIAGTAGRDGLVLDRLFVQVGGGALASACAQGLRTAVSLGAIERMPRIHAVQTEGGWPLRRAYERVRARILGGAAPASERAAADAMRDAARGPAVRESLSHALAHRSEFMWPWEPAPRSIARGILDDETYDWYAVVVAMMETGGWPVTVSEARLAEAHALGREATGVGADPTGTAGLAGLVELRARGEVGPDECVAVLFTGIER